MSKRVIIKYPAGKVIPPEAILVPAGNHMSSAPPAELAACKTCHEPVIVRPQQPVAATSGVPVFRLPPFPQLPAFPQLPQFPKPQLTQQGLENAAAGALDTSAAQASGLAVDVARTFPDPRNVPQVIALNAVNNAAMAPMEIIKAVFSLFMRSGGGK